MPRKSDPDPVADPDPDEIRRFLEIFHVAVRPDPDKMDEEMNQRWRTLNAEIGYISTEWAAMEMALAGLFAALLKTKLSYSLVILGTLTANKVRRDLVMNVARLGLASNRSLHKVEALMRRMAKVARKRNFLIHGLGVFHTKHPDRLTLTTISADLDPALMHYEAWGLDDLQELRRTLSALTVDLDAAAIALGNARRRTLLETRPQGHLQAKIIDNSHRPPPRGKRQAQPAPSRG